MLMKIAAYAALFIFLVGFFGRLGWYAWLIIRYPRIIKRASTSSKPIRRSVISAAWIANVWPYATFWWRTNPLIFVGHVLYHVGLFTGLGTYGLVMLVSWQKICRLSLTEAITFVADWFQHKELIFGSIGWLANVGDILYWSFAGALTIAVIGIATPYIASILNMRGIIRPPDRASYKAGVGKLPGPRLNTMLRIERKIVGLIALTMDVAMLSTFAFPAMVEVATIIHVVFGLTILASLPYGFLRHEIFRVGMVGAVYRHMQGYT